MALFAVAAFLLFLIQCLRLFDLVSDKGQSLLTLLGQALLGMPGLGMVFLYVCLGIGLGRALRNLQASSELRIIHSNGLVPALLRAIGLYIAGRRGARAAAVACARSARASASTNDWSQSIAADLVSRSMIPHRFTALGGGVSMVIGGRDARATSPTSSPTTRATRSRTAPISPNPRSSPTTSRATCCACTTARCSI